MLDFVALKTLVTLFESGSLSLTASRLSLTQACVSKEVARIENYLGVSLTVETAQKITPSPQGLIFESYAHKILGLREQMMISIAHSEKKNNDIRIGSSESVVMLLLTEILDQFYENFPLVRFDLQVDTSDRLRNQLLAGEFDLVFLIGGVGNSEFVDIPLIEYEMGFFVGKQEQAKCDFRELIKMYPLMTFSRDTAPYIELVKNLELEGIEGCAIHSCASLSALISLTVNGAGIGVFPREVLHQEPWKDQLTEVSAFPIKSLNYFASFRNLTDKDTKQRLADIALEVAKNSSHQNVSQKVSPNTPHSPL